MGNTNRLISPSKYARSANTIPCSVIYGRPVGVGVKFGAKAKLSEEQVNELRRRRESGEKVRDLMSDFGISSDLD
jgi:hypothetical protein